MKSHNTCGSLAQGSSRFSFKKIFKKPKKGAFQELIGKLSNGIMMPIAVLPIAGLLLGIGAAIQNNIPTNSPQALLAFAAFLKNAGDFVFGNLAVLFAVAIAIAFTRDSGVAALSTLVAWICFNGMQNALIFQDSNTKLYSMLYWNGLPSSIFGTNVGIYSLQTSVFGGAIVGAVVAKLYNRFYQIQMPKILGFFSGTRFVPIISLLTMMPLAILFAMVWPGIGLGLSEMGNGLGELSANGGANALIFGYIERALVPFGLHHAFYAPLWYTSAGGNMTNAGEIIPFIRLGNEVFAVTGVIGADGVESIFNTMPTWKDIIEKLSGADFNPDKWIGDQTLWFALNSSLLGKQLILSNEEHYTITLQTFAQNTMNQNLAAVTASEELWVQLSTNKNGISFNPQQFKVAFPGVNPGQYEQGKYPFMIFGLPAAAAAMVMAAPKENRKTAASIIGSAALTSFLTGITEPLEFTFLFLAPWLYWGVHAILCSISFWLMSLLGANVGQTFSGGIIDLGLYGFLPDALGLKANSYFAIIIGLGYIPIYYTLFYFLVKRFDLKTPGRGGSLVTKKEYLAAKNANNNSTFNEKQIVAYKLIDAFGGKDNIELVNACITKLRVNIKDGSKVNEELIKELGAQGIVHHSPTLIHAIFGTDSEPIKTQMNNIINNTIDVNELAKVAEAPKEVQPKSQILDEITIYAPFSGTVKSLKDVDDAVFSQAIMGDGVAIEPDQNHTSVLVPYDQSTVVDVAFPTGHAYVVDVSGAKVMIHIGIDTVSLNPNVSDPKDLIGFSPKVKAGDNPSGYANLVDVDFELIKQKNLKTITPVIVMTESLKDYDIEIVATINSHVNVKDPLFKLKRKS